MTDVMQDADNYLPSSGDEAGTIRVGGRTYAYGLLWQLLGADETAKKKVREISQDDEAADLFCHRQHEQAQLGIGWTVAGHKAWQPVLAAHIAQSVAANCVGVFPVEQGGYYLVALRDGLIEPHNGDRLFDDENQARSALLEWLDEFDSWDQIIAPADWDIEDAEPASDIDTHLAGSAKVKLRPVTRRKQMIALGIFTVLLVAGGYMGLQQLKEHWRQERIERQRAIQKQQEEQKIPYTYQNDPKGFQVLVACVEKMRSVPAAYPGFQLKRMTCDGDAVVARLSQDVGTPGWLRHSLENRGFSDASVRVNKTNVKITYPIEIGYDTWSRLDDGDLLARKTLMRNMRARTEERFVTLSSEGRSPNEVTAQTRFTLSGLDNVESYYSWFSDVPALTLREVILQAGGSLDESWLWTIKGQFHEHKSNPRN